MPFSLKVAAIEEMVKTTVLVMRFNCSSVTHPTWNTPYRQVPPNDRRGRRNQHPRHYNVNLSPFLPLLISGSGRINICRMEEGYLVISESINNLAYNGRICKTHQINKDL